MQMILIVLGVIVAYIFLKKPAANNNPTVQTTGTANKGLSAWFPGWNGFTQASLQNQTSNVNNTVNSLKTLSNSFGFNDGGTNPGVAVSGSNNGGVQSSGSGTSNPLQNNSSDLGVTTFPADYTDFYVTPDFGG